MLALFSIIAHNRYFTDQTNDCEPFWYGRYKELFLTSFKPIDALNQHEMTLTWQLLILSSYLQGKSVTWNDAQLWSSKVMSGNNESACHFAHHMNSTDGKSIPATSIARGMLDRVRLRCTDETVTCTHGSAASCVTVSTVSEQEMTIFYTIQNKNI